MTVWHPIRRSALYHKHLEVGASMEARDGWQQPARYTSVAAELRRLRESVGLCDISPSSKLSLKGNEVEHLLAAVFADATGMIVGEVRRVAGKHGSGAAPVVLARLAFDEYLALAPAGRASTLSQILGGDPERCAHVVDVTSGLAGVGINGPKVGLVLGQISELDTSAAAFADMCCAQSKVAEIQGALLRMDRAGVPGYELYFAREFGEYLWDVLIEAAAEHGGGPVGIEAMERL